MVAFLGLALSPPVVSSRRNTMEAAQKPWQAAFAILLIVLVSWLVPTFATALFRVPHSRDPARRCFAWLKLALFLMSA